MTDSDGSGWRGLQVQESLARVCHPISQVVCNENIAVAESGVWHCIPCMFPSSSGLDDQLADPTRGGVHAQLLVDRPLPGLGPRRLARGQHASVRLAEDRGRPPPTRQATAQRRPTGRLPARPQALPDHRDQLAGEHRQAQVARAARGPAVVDRARSQFAPEGAEDGLQVGRRHTGAPQPLGVPADAVGAQAVDAGMGRPAALQRLPFPGHRRRVAALVVGLHVDRMLRACSREMRCRTFSTRLIVPWRDRPSCSVRRAVSRRAPACPAIARSCSARCADAQRRRVSPFPSVSAQASTRCPPAVPMAAARLSSKTRRRSRSQATFPSVARPLSSTTTASGDVAGQDPGAAHEAAGVQHQAQREQRTVVALLPGMAAAGQQLPVRRALEAGAGPVVERDGGLPVEQSDGALKKTRPDRLAVAQEVVAGALQGVPAHGLEVAAEQLA